MEALAANARLGNWLLEPLHVIFTPNKGNQNYVRLQIMWLKIMNRNKKFHPNITVTTM